MSHEATALRQTMGVVIPFPGNRDAEVRRMHREGIASEKRNGRNVVLIMISVVFAIGASVAFGAGYIQAKL